ncbi:MAG: hypothetical protein ABEL76_05075 [Bradymonadaceae bacterium]
MHIDYRSVAILGAALLVAACSGGGGGGGSDGEPDVGRDAGSDVRDGGGDAPSMDTADSGNDTEAFVSTAVALGESHTCAIDTNGRLWCWGKNAEGQLGDGTNEYRPSPVQTGSSAAWVELGAAASYTCGRRSDGTLWCWGNSPHRGGKPTPQEIVAPDDNDIRWQAVATGRRHACALDRGGALWCWGARDREQTGDRSFDTHPNSPGRVGDRTDWTAIAAGGDHSCGIHGDSTLRCWGANGNGELGQGSAGSAKEKAVKVDGAWTDVAVGGDHTCGVRDDGSLSCWGANDHGQLGLGPDDYGAPSPDPTKTVGAGKTWSSVVAGREFTCGLKEDGTVWCWGANLFGQVGDASRQDQPAPKQLGDSTWKAVRAGATHVCARNTDDELKCWGYNGYGQLGADPGLKTRAVPVDPTISWKSADAGNAITCGVNSASKLLCWGFNKNGLLGLDISVHARFPRTVGSAENWKSVSVGDRHVCGTRQDGTLWCWGKNQFGQLGNGNSGPNAVTTSPERIRKGEATWKTVTTGTAHTCAIAGSDKAYCWGNNGAGRLGNGKSSNRPSPTRVQGSASWDQLRAGGAHTCGIQTNGTLWCWGSNAVGQLGFDAGFQKKSPGQVGDKRDWSDVATGERHTCGVRENGTLWCWGNNADGQLGLGENAPRNRERPRRIGGRNWRDVAAGTAHTCGVKVGGSVHCWGRSETGQLGNETASPDASEPAPVRVTGGIGFRMPFLGAGHSCGLKTSGSMWCWGSNDVGQIGDGSAWSASPVFVSVPEDF